MLNKDFDFEKAFLARLAKSKKHKAHPKWDLNKMLLEKQKEFFYDESKRKAVCAGRRSGKTELAAIALLDSCIKYPKSNNIFISDSKDQAARNVWGKFRSYIMDYGLNVRKLDETNLIINFDNESSIFLLAGSKIDDRAKIRGLGNMKLAVIDECQNLDRNDALNHLIYSIVAPMCTDLGGSIWCCGTPGIARAGLWWRITNHETEFKSFHWTFRDNFFLLDKRKENEDEIKAKEQNKNIYDVIFERVLWEDAGCDLTTKDERHRREWFGEWVEGAEHLVFQYSSTLNTYKILPEAEPEDWKYVIGIDTGFNDADAIIVLGWLPQLMKGRDPKTYTSYLYVVEEDIKRKQTWDELAQKIKEFEAKYKPEKMILDYGSGGAKFIEDIKQRFDLFVEPASEKNKKTEYINLINNDLKKGIIKCYPESTLANDFVRVKFDPVKTTSDKIVFHRAGNSFHSDSVDAFIYAYMASTHFRDEGFKYTPPEYGSKEYKQKEAKELFEQVKEQAKRKHELDEFVDDEIDVFPFPNVIEYDFY